MSAAMSHGSSAEPDLTPMLDMVFQLVTFFMLVMNFKANAMDLTLKLPVVGSARPVETGGQEELLILNINSQGELIIYNISQKDIDGYIQGEAQASKLSARVKGVTLPESGELPTTVVIRADRKTTFHSLNRVIGACQKNGFRKFAFMATDKEEEA